MKNAESGSKGYVLMEVMLAAGIFAMAGVGLAVALNDVAKTFVEARKVTHIRMELASRLAEARLLDLAPQKTSEEPGPDGITYEKEITALNFKKFNPLVTLNSDEPLEGLYCLTIRANWQEGKNLLSEKAEVYVYQP